ncbi:MAG TPA: hypothetical protein DDW52_17695 [Planctomycetaceae bacterium]|nr:hypothetical protein [Planctomycetaceae bacterium]
MLDQVQLFFSTWTVFKAALACWIALGINVLAGRVSSTWCICAAAASGLAGLVAAQLEIGTRAPVWAFLSALVIAGCALYASLRAAGSRAGTGGDKSSRGFAFWMGGLATVLGACICVLAVSQLVPKSELAWAGPSLLTLCNCLGLAAALVAAVELTFGRADAASADKSTESKTLLRYCCVAAVLGFSGPVVAGCGLIFGEYPASQIDGQMMREEFRLLAWLYIGTSMTVYAVIAIGLQQLLQRRSRLRPGQVATTTISIWLAAAGMIVILGMPHNWPWLVNADADALVGELFEE